MTERNILLVVHTRRAEALAAAQLVCEQLILAGVTPVMTGLELKEARDYSAQQVLAQDAFESVKELGVHCTIKELELAMVLGGDGTILKAAEIVRDAATPLVGINLGHVGFLAESERDALGDVLKRVLDLDYQLHELMALEVTVFVDGEQEYSTWALNEATVEKSERERMLEVVVEVEGRPLSSFGCDGMVVSTPTGSTAYAFSAGGPVIWPSVEALLVVPLSAHALFSRPLVVNPGSLVAVEVLKRSSGNGVLWCDGRRTRALPPGARVEVRRSPKPVTLARLHEGTFTDRLVRKFDLPVAGWRGPESDGPQA